MDKLALLSADSHVEEPPGLWVDEIPEKMLGDLPPEMRATDSEMQFALRVGAKKEGELTAAEIEGERHRQAVASLGTTDVDARFKIMREENVLAECIYPTKGLYLWNMDNPETGALCARVYNDWIYDLLESRSERFCCAAMIPTWNVEDAIAEVQRSAAMGMGALLLPIVGTPPFNHKQWEPLWSAIEETGLPIVMHQGTGHDMLFYRGPGAAVSNLLATQSMAPRTASLLATSGVLENHPNLHFVFVETNAAWISWAMTTLDHYDRSFRQYVGWVRPELKEPPSYYLKRQIHGTFQIDDVAIGMVPFTGTSVALWGSDYPHAEGTYPNSQQIVSGMMKGLSSKDRNALVFDNTADLFKFDRERILQPF
ncbi:MAG: amidohydrolase [Sphingomonadaceae bacterium]|nr:amidohydrolase [Sphingomonadaceae bacterium]